MSDNDPNVTARAVLHEMDGGDVWPALLLATPVTTFTIVVPPELAEEIAGGLAEVLAEAAEQARITNRERANDADDDRQDDAAAEAAAANVT